MNMKQGPFLKTSYEGFQTILNFQNDKIQDEVKKIQNDNLPTNMINVNDITEDPKIHKKLQYFFLRNNPIMKSLIDYQCK